MKEGQAIIKNYREARKPQNSPGGCVSSRVFHVKRVWLNCRQLFAYHGIANEDDDLPGCDHPECQSSDEEDSNDHTAKTNANFNDVNTSGPEQEENMVDTLSQQPLPFRAGLSSQLFKSTTFESPLTTEENRQSIGSLENTLSQPLGETLSQCPLPFRARFSSQLFKSTTFESPLTTERNRQSIESMEDTLSQPLGETLSQQPLPFHARFSSQLFKSTTFESPLTTEGNRQSIESLGETSQPPLPFRTSLNSQFFQSTTFESPLTEGNRQSVGSWGALTQAPLPFHAGLPSQLFKSTIYESSLTEGNRQSYGSLEEQTLGETLSQHPLPFRAGFSSQFFNSTNFESPLATEGSRSRQSYGSLEDTLSQSMEKTLSQHPLPSRTSFSSQFFNSTNFESPLATEGSRQSIESLEDTFSQSLGKTLSEHPLPSRASSQFFNSTISESPLTTEENRQSIESLEDTLSQSLGEALSQHSLPSRVGSPSQLFNSITSDHESPLTTEENLHAIIPRQRIIFKKPTPLAFRGKRQSLEGFAKTLSQPQLSFSTLSPIKPLSQGPPQQSSNLVKTPDLFDYNISDESGFSSGGNDALASPTPKHFSQGLSLLSPRTIPKPGDIFDESGVSSGGNGIDGTFAFASPTPMHLCQGPVLPSPDLVYQPKLVRKNLDSPSIVLGLRRSTRNRLPRLQAALGQHPIYKTDTQGNRVLIGAEPVKVKDRFAKKHRVMDPVMAMDKEQESKRRKRIFKNNRKRARLAMSEQRELSDVDEDSKENEDVGWDETIEGNEKREPHWDEDNEIYY